MPITSYNLSKQREGQKMWKNDNWKACRYLHQILIYDHLRLSGFFCFYWTNSKKSQAPQGLNILSNWNDICYYILPLMFFHWICIINKRTSNTYKHNSFKFKCKSTYSSNMVTPKFVKSVFSSWDNLWHVFLSIVIRFNGYWSYRVLYFRYAYSFKHTLWNAHPVDHFSLFLLHWQ